MMCEHIIKSSEMADMSAGHSDHGNVNVLKTSEGL